MAELKYKDGDATKPIGKGPRVILHCCNDIGAWGAGFVVAVSDTFGKDAMSPEMKYRDWADKGTTQLYSGSPEKVKFELGAVQFVYTNQTDVWVANMIGQHNVGSKKSKEPPIRYHAINDGLKATAAFCKRTKAAVHCCRFGSGLAGGDWLLIEAMIKELLVAEGVDVTVYNYVCANPPKGAV